MDSSGRVNSVLLHLHLSLSPSLYLSTVVLKPQTFLSSNKFTSWRNWWADQEARYADRPPHKSANQCERLTTTRFLCLYQHVFCFVIKQSGRIPSPAVSDPNAPINYSNVLAYITYICKSGICEQLLLVNFFPSISCLVFPTIIAKSFTDVSLLLHSIIATLGSSYLIISTHS